MDHFYAMFSCDDRPGGRVASFPGLPTQRFVGFVLQATKAGNGESVVPRSLVYCYIRVIVSFDVTFSFPTPTTIFRCCRLLRAERFDPEWHQCGNGCCNGGGAQRSKPRLLQEEIHMAMEKVKPTKRVPCTWVPGWICLVFRPKP